ncbi:hypothetical protein OMO38_19475 [Chryseobacterium sp. 09-1422]|uniref:Uncharacterized protein n=1 Tax=Chryseobacterium kimseyorum TaxID=2984028 RepID=A0ABT3I3R8_9FLAO|nr:hypothetical protein [Chryseobacterium kimseyorum]MCW3170716.1 hypothetical protein [Chryseobacterium kimseyorum]
MKSFKTIIICFSFAVINCSTVKTTEIYGTEMEIVKNVRSKVLIEKFNAYDKDKSFLTFMSEFDNFITVKNGDSLIFSKKSKTMPMLGFTTACIIFNNRNITIRINF